MLTFSPEVLTDFATRLLVAGGVAYEESLLIARSLVGANLRGHDSHGVMRIPSYLDLCRQGEVVPGAPLTAIRQSPGVFVGDAHWGFGQTQAQRLTRKLIDMADHSALAVGTLIRSSHVGRLGEYCEMVAAAGLVSMLMVEIFAGALSGGVCIREVPINQNGNCVFMLVLNPGNLGGAEHFAKEVAGLTQFVRSCPTVEGVSEILLPGDPERGTLVQRSEHGIPLDDGNWGELIRLAQQLGVAVPN